MKPEHETGYRIGQHEREIELGQGAAAAEVQQQADRIAATWQPPKLKPQHPTLLLLGGFQGSGKTTTLELLNTDNSLLVISPDEIRHNLFAQSYPFSEQFVRLVNATKFELVRRVLELGYSLAVDQALTPDRVKLIKKLLNTHPEYKLLSVFLHATPEVLTQRVEHRPSLSGRYRGTVTELHASIAKYTAYYGAPEDGGYDLLLDAVTNNPGDIARIIQSTLEHP